MILCSNLASARAPCPVYLTLHRDLNIILSASRIPSLLQTVSCLMNLLAGLVLRQAEGFPNEAVLDESFGPSTSPPIDDDYPVLPEHTPIARESESSQSRLQKKYAKVPRTKTAFRFAHPPPAVKHKQRLNIRPRLLLQIHETSSTKRPIPILDIFPSGVFAPRLARKVPRLLAGRIGLEADELVIVRSQKYEDSNSESDEEAFCRDSNAREAIAVISQSKRSPEGTGDRTELRFHDGRCWRASLGANGRYDITSVDETGLETTARWVPRRCTTSRSLNSSMQEIEDVRYSFSLIGANTRRHPIIATLNEYSIDVYDNYTVPPPVSPFKRQQSSETTSVSLKDEEHEDYSRLSTADPGLVEVDEALRSLIIISGIWIALHQGYFRDRTVAKAGPSPPASPSLRSSFRGRSRSQTVDSIFASSSNQHSLVRTQQRRSEQQNEQFKSSTSSAGALESMDILPAIPPVKSLQNSVLEYKSRHRSVDEAQRHQSDVHRSNLSQQQGRHFDQREMKLTGQSTNTASVGVASKTTSALAPDNYEARSPTASKVKRLLGLGKS